MLSKYLKKAAAVMSSGQGKPCSKQDQVRRAAFAVMTEGFHSAPEVGRTEHAGDVVPR